MEDLTLWGEWMAGNGMRWGQEGVGGWEGGETVVALYNE